MKAAFNKALCGSLLHPLFNFLMHEIIAIELVMFVFLVMYRLIGGRCYGDWRFSLFLPYSYYAGTEGTMRFSGWGIESANSSRILTPEHHSYSATVMKNISSSLRYGT